MKRRKTPKGLQPALNPVQVSHNLCLDVQDQSILKTSAVEFFKLRGLRDPNAQAARLADQFIAQNRPLLATLDATLEHSFDGREVTLVLHTGNAVGAIPLLSPTSARYEYGLVIQPRFPWSGLGSMLLQMGWRLAPRALKLPQLNSSERRVPQWVLSLMVLTRLGALLDVLRPRFERVINDLPAPRGTVSWSDYATRSLPTANLLSFHCSFSDLRQDKALLAAIRYAAELQRGLLESQKQHGVFVHRLIEIADQIIHRLRGFVPMPPSSVSLAGWLRLPLRNSRFLEGIEVIEWTLQERGLAGLSTLAGIPWTMRMDEFYEAWVETVFTLVARRIGATVSVGRLRQTVHAIQWQPPSLGSQKSLIPDICLESERLSIIVDAKYKGHLQELRYDQWSALEKDVQEQHRNDLFQALAYAHLAKSSNVVVILAYPCSQDAWTSLKERGQTVHQATINANHKTLQVWLAAVPMIVDASQIAFELSERILAIDS